MLFLLVVLPLPPSPPVPRTIYLDTFQSPATHVYSTCYWWESAADCAGTNGEMEIYLPQQVMTQSDGLHLVAVAQPYITAKGTTYAYRSGMITTDGHFTFLYGTVRVRAQVPRGKGLWPAIWLLPQNRASGVELDLMENLGSDPHTVYQGVHYVGADGAHQHDGGSYTGPDFSQGFHTFQMDWEPTRIVWSIDGVVVRTCANPLEIPHTPMFLIANLAVGGAWPGPPDVTTPFPADFIINMLQVQQ